MTETNTKFDISQDHLDVEHELPLSDNVRQDQLKAAPHADSNNVSDLSGELQKVTIERDELRNRLARAQAEFENARKRAAKEQRDFQDFALADVLKSLLPVIDSFDQALQAPAQNLEEFRFGVDLIRKQLHDTLTKLGLRQIPTKGEPFDPYLHEAVELVHTTAAEDNHILNEMQRGYKLRDRLLRPARVAVARTTEEKVA
jgi:molecular chaperone GrpE